MVETTTVTRTFVQGNGGIYITIGLFVFNICSTYAEKKVVDTPILARMLCLPQSTQKLMCETAYHDRCKTVEDWPEWQEEFYGECPSSVYRVPYNKEGFVPLFFVTDKGRQEYDAVAVGHAILTHMVRHGWFPMQVFNTDVLQNMCGLVLGNIVSKSELLRLVLTTHRLKTRLTKMVDMLVEKSQQLDRRGWSNLELDPTSPDVSVDRIESLFNNFGIHVDQDIFVMDTDGVVTTTEDLVLHHSSIEFRIRRLLSNWFCVWPYYEHLKSAPEFHAQHYNTRNVQCRNIAK